ncbi:MAG TPA: alternative ribosome rescue aminoacyl-tRNA hydrolase ArfB [Steroidobacteraceae bacterium]|nr:alternative ribosome rescue aminoacyl-tRNA hydrolase ArfB [Steroidobacteraceae bacterium]
MDIETLASIGVPETALTFRAIRSSGPGGQNVNKVSTAIQLQCDLNQCWLNDESKSRLRTLAGRRVSSDDVITIVAQRLRTQEQNKRDAMERLHELVSQALIVPKMRRATKPSKSSKRKRVDAKVQHGKTKQLRGRVTSHD